MVAGKVVPLFFVTTVEGQLVLVAFVASALSMMVNYPSMPEERTAITLTFRDSPDQMLELPLPPPDIWTEQGR